MDHNPVMNKKCDMGSGCYDAEDKTCELFENDYVLIKSDDFPKPTLLKVFNGEVCIKDCWGEYIPFDQKYIDKNWVVVCGNKYQGKF
jgi:hypothetical protein